LGITSLRITVLLFALVLLLQPVNLCAQKIYSLGGASILQTIDVKNYKVEDITTLSPSMSDIAFHPDGTLYGVNENSIYEIDITDGSSAVIRQLPSSLGWLVGLTIDYNGVFFLSSVGTDQDFVLKYDPSDDTISKLGSAGWPHWDLEFYNGQLYLTGGKENSSNGYLIRADLSDLTLSTIIMDFGPQAYGMTSFNNICGGNLLVASTPKKIIRLDPRSILFESKDMNDPLYTYSSGTASRTSYLGSLPPLKVDFVEIGKRPCAVDETTSVEIFIYPGRTDVEFSVDGINYQSSPFFSDVPVGIHQGYIRDGLGCTDMSDPFEIKSSTLTFTTQSQAAHCDDENGVIIPTATISSDSLEFSLNGIDFYLSPEFNNLPGGTHTIYVKNTLDCIDSAFVKVEELPGLKHQSMTTPEHCDQSDGKIEVIASGGMAPYSYSFVALPQQSEPIFTGLHSSSYLVRVRDILGCESEGLIEVEVAPSPMIEDILIQEAHCDMPDGSAEIIAQSTYGPLEYSINGEPYTTIPQFENLSPGVYELNVIDEFGCDSTTSFVIPAKDGPVIQNITIENDFCSSSAGSIEIYATASTGTLTYSINNGSFSNSAIFTDLTSGAYLVTVRDRFGCDAFENVTVDEEPAPVISVIETVDATCNESNGSITVSQNMSIDVMYSLNNIDFQQQAVFTDLSPNDYSVYIIDNKGCIDSIKTSILNIKPTGVLDILITDESCRGRDGILKIVPDISNTEIQYSIDGSNFQINDVFNSLQGNNYTGYIIDENGCIDSMQVIIQSKEGVELNKITTTQEYCGNSDGSIAIQAEGKLEVTLNGESFDSYDLITDLEEGVYNVTLTNESECTIDTIVEITGIDCDAIIPDKSYSIFIPNAFSPNGDGVNETLSPFFDPSLYQLLQFQVFDRWGNNVFKCNDQCTWDGMNSGEPSPAGVYVFVMHIQDENGDISETSGDLTLVR